MHQACICFRCNDKNQVKLLTFKQFVNLIKKKNELKNFIVDLVHV
jgi:hypothetical protein